MANRYPHAHWGFLSPSHAAAIPKALDEIVDPNSEGPMMFRVYRDFIGWTQKQLAEEMCVTVASVSRWESGSVPISQNVMQHLRAIVINQISKQRGPLWYLYFNYPEIQWETVTLECAYAMGVV